MKRRKLFVASIILLAACIVPGLQGSTYAQDFVNLNSKDKPKDNAESTGKPENNFPTTHDQDKGSPMHGWKAVVLAGFKKGDTFTVQDFMKMRNWSATTRGYELRSLVGIGVLGRVAGKKGTYKVLVDATSEQIDEINKKAIPVVDRKGIYGESLGIDGYRLDASYLGKGDIKRGKEIVNKISSAIAEVTGNKVKPREGYAEDFVTEDEQNGIGLPASVFINEEKSFTVAGKKLGEYKGVSEDTNQSKLLASLVDTGIVPSSAMRTGETYDFSSVKIKTVLFKAKFVTKNPKGFRDKFEILEQDETAVIVTEIGDKNEKAIRDVLEKMGLLTEWGGRIVVIGVMPDSPSAAAFAKLFGDKGFHDLRGQDTKDVLNNKQLVDALGGAV